MIFFNHEEREEDAKAAKWDALFFHTSIAKNPRNKYL